MHFLPPLTFGAGYKSLSKITSLKNYLRHKAIKFKTDKC